MRRSDHTDDEISHLLAEAAAGVPIDDICRTAHISLRTFYRWRKRFGGLKQSGFERLHTLEDENRNLRRQLNALLRSDRLLAAQKGSEAPRPEFGISSIRCQDGLSIGRYPGVRVRQ